MKGDSNNCEQKKGRAPFGSAASIQRLRPNLLNQLRRLDSSKINSTTTTTHDVSVNGLNVARVDVGIITDSAARFDVDLREGFDRGVAISSAPGEIDYWHCNQTWVS